MGEILSETDIPREEGYLYYTGTDKKGNITVCRAKMVHGRRKGTGKKNK